MNPGLASSYACCRTLARRNGTTYYWASSLLPRDRRPFVWALYGFARVADRNQRNALRPKPVERFVERRRNPFDQHDQRRSAGSGQAACLIFDQCSAGERKQGAKPARIIFLIGTDQGAERHR